MRNEKLKKGKKAVRNRNLTTEDLKIGFPMFEGYQDNEFDKYKRRLGMAPGARLVVRWK